MKRSTPEYLRLKLEWLSVMATRRAVRGPALHHRPVAPWQAWQVDPCSQEPVVIPATSRREPSEPGFAFVKINEYEACKKRRRPLEAMKIRPGLILSDWRVHDQNLAWVAYMSRTGDHPLSVRMPDDSGTQAQANAGEGIENNEEMGGSSWCWVTKQVAVSFTDELPVLPDQSVFHRLSKEDVAKYCQEVADLELVAYTTRFNPQHPQMQAVRERIDRLLNAFVSQHPGSSHLSGCPRRDPKAPPPGEIVLCRNSTGDFFRAVVLDSVILYSDQKEHENNLVLTCRLLDPTCETLNADARDLEEAGRLRITDANTVTIYENNDADEVRIELPFVVAVPLLRPVLRREVTRCMGNIRDNVRVLRDMYHHLRVH